MSIVTQDQDSIVHQHAIKVVKHRGELMFDLDGLRFDVINPEHMLWQGDNINVIRHERQIDSIIVDWLGTHGAYLAFWGVDHIDVQPDQPRYDHGGVVEELYPSDFLPGDELELQWSLALTKSDGTMASITHTLPLHWRLQLLGASGQTARIRPKLHPQRRCR